MSHKYEKKMIGKLKWKYFMAYYDLGILKIINQLQNIKLIFYWNVK